MKSDSSSIVVDLHGFVRRFAFLFGSSIVVLRQMI